MNSVSLRVLQIRAALLGLMHRLYAAEWWRDWASWRFSPRELMIRFQLAFANVVFATFVYTDRFEGCWRDHLPFSHY
jgi:hypothetical protein